ncbi:Bcr/CflA family efflux MFS transporter [Vibrio sp. FNV 38]|nr:Bcr/CflA family efflux MFS transporter [Vibrio sp. FNV 38]
MSTNKQLNLAPKTTTLVLLTGLSAMAMTIFLPSLVQMQTYFQTEPYLIQLSISGYIFMTAIVQLLAGALSDKYGRRWVTLISLGIFALATLGCLLSTNIWTFLFFRSLQAVIISVVVVARSVVRDVCTGQEAARRMSYIMMGMSVVPMIAPAIGGVLGEIWGWKAGFYILLLCTFFVAFMSWRDLKETAPKQNISITAQFRCYPELLKTPSFILFTLITMFSTGSFFIFLTAAPLLASDYFQLSPSGFSLYYAITPVGYLFGNYLTGKLAKSTPSDQLILTGTLMASSGLVSIIVLALTGFDAALIFFGFMFLVGLGNGLIVPNAMIRMLDVSPVLVGSASGLGGALMTAGGAVLSVGSDFVVYPESGVIPVTVLILSCFIIIPVFLNVANRLHRNHLNKAEPLA